MVVRIIKKLTGEIETPRRSTERSAGYDVFASYVSNIKAGEDTYVTLPVAMEFNPATHRAILFLRSSIGMKKNIRFVEDGRVVPYIELTPNVEGIEKAVILRNVGNEDFLLEKGMHFSQIIIVDKEVTRRPFILEKVKDLQGVLAVSLSVKQKENFVQALVLEEELIIQPKQSYMIPTGYCARIDGDSFLGAFVPKEEKRFIFSNGVAIVDADYYFALNGGLMYCKLENTTDEVLKLTVGTEIMDLINIPFHTVEGEIVPTRKRIGGIGSTTEQLKTAN